MTDITPKRRANSIRAEAAFRAEVARQGGTVLGEWVNARTRILVRCASGHDCYPTPTNTARGVGICRTCAGQDPKAAEAAFRAEVERQGGTVVGAYVNALTPVQVRCASGHHCRPWPSYLAASSGNICPVCAKRARGLSEPQYRQRVAELGGVVLGDFVNIHTPVLVRCREGHENAVTPHHVLRGIGICSTCAGNARGVSEGRFREAVARLGGEVIGRFTNVATRLLVRCPKGHETEVKPSNVLAGQGICRVCRGKVWDVFYTVVDDGFDLLKFGITSGDPRARLRDHALDGFERVVRLHERLPDGVARELEDNVKAALRDAREEPARGVEYFPLRVLPLVLDIVDHHPATRPELAGSSSSAR